jgi:PAS domain S-box-containing protein
MRNPPAPHLATLWRALARWAPEAWPTALVGSAYYAGSLIGFALRLPASGISFLWPPTAILTAVLLVTPPRAWTGYLAASLIAHGVAHAWDGIPIEIWLSQFAANGIQALLAVFVVQRYSRGSALFQDLRTVTIFIVGASIVAPGAASLVAAGAYVTMGWATDFSHAWRARVLSNFTSSITIVPLIVVTVHHVRSRTDRIPLRRIIQFGALLAALIVTCYAATEFQPEGWPVPPALYVPVPFLLWAAVRFGPAALSGALLCTTLLAIWSALRGRNPFAANTPTDTVIAVQLFVGVTVVPLMLMAGLIEENRRERRTILESEQRTTAILRAVPDLMFLQTRDGVYLNYYASNGGELLVPPEVFVGKNMRDVLPPDLAARFADAFQQATEEVPSRVEYSLIVAGVPRQYEARLIAVDSDKILSIVRDITERTQSETALRESERRYALATASGGVGIWALDLVAGDVYIDPALKRALGYREPDVTTTPSAWRDLVHPVDVELITSSVKALVSGNSDRMEVEHRMIQSDGSMRWFLTKGEITERRDGAAVRITGTSTDITARKDAEHALKEAQTDLARMARLTALGELTVSIAHEINQPLCAIVANANACLHWLEEHASTDDVRAALNDIVHEGHRASQIIQRTRELFANRPPHRRPLDLNDLVREVLDITGERLRRSGINLKLTLDAALPLVYADEVQIQQVMLNLVQNAIDAMRDRTDERRFLRVRSHSTGAYATVSVRDTGGGLPPRNVERIFDPFFSTKPDGNGIGLAISRSIVKAHDGALWATANARCGATFRFKIPAISNEHG